MTGTSHYEILGASKHASAADIRTAYRALAKVTHPDRGRTDALFRLVRVAYETLHDTQARARYDGDTAAPAPSGTPGASERAARAAANARAAARYHVRGSFAADGVTALTHAQRVQAERDAFQFLEPTWFTAPHDVRVARAMRTNRRAARVWAASYRHPVRRSQALGPLLVFALGLLGRLAGAGLPSGPPGSVHVAGQYLNNYYPFDATSVKAWVLLIIGNVAVTAALWVLQRFRARLGPYRWYEPLPVWFLAAAMFCDGQDLARLPAWDLAAGAVTIGYLAWVALLIVVPRPLSPAAWTSIHEWFAEVGEEWRLARHVRVGRLRYLVLRSPVSRLWGRCTGRRARRRATRSA